MLYINIYRCQLALQHHSGQHPDTKVTLQVKGAGRQGRGTFSPQDCGSWMLYGIQSDSAPNG